MSTTTTTNTTTKPTATTGPASPPSPTFLELASAFDRASLAAAAAAGAGTRDAGRPEAERARLSAEVARAMAGHGDGGAKYVRISPTRLIIDTTVRHPAGQVFVATGPATYRSETVTPEPEWSTLVVDLADADDL